MSQLVYICGALTSDDDQYLSFNIEAAQWMHRAVLLRGHNPLCLFLSDHNFEFNSDITYQVWLNNAIRVMLKCDCIMLTDNHNNSSSLGVLTELYYAKQAMIPVYTKPLQLPYIEREKVQDLKLPDNFNPTYEQLLKEVRK